MAADYNKIRRVRKKLYYIISFLFIKKEQYGKIVNNNKGFIISIILLFKHYKKLSEMFCCKIETFLMGAIINQLEKKRFYTELVCKSKSCFR